MVQLEAFLDAQVWGKTQSLPQINLLFCHRVASTVKRMLARELNMKV
jgi:hypothetical protein